MRPLDEKDFATAAQLLHEGFPSLRPAFWMAALRRLQQYGCNRQAGAPLGWFMMEGEQAVGVMLTPLSLRHRPDGSHQRVVNLSSWYVRPEFRWRAGFMLRQVLNDASAVYTDLTPSPEVQKMLPLLGFQAINPGVAVVPLPLLCLHPASGAQMRVLQAGEPWAHAGPPRVQIESHRELGCLPLVLQPATGTAQLVVVKRMRVRGVPAAQLVYADSISQLLAHRGALARLLLRQGVLLFVHDARQPGSTPTRWFRRRDLWFVRGQCFADRTDAFGSELCIIHTRAAPAPAGPGATRTAGPAC